jgi:hypothetical protein
MIPLPAVSDMQRIIFATITAFVAEMNPYDPTIAEVLATAAQRSQTKEWECVIAWDRLAGYDSAMWVTSAGRVALRGREPRPLPEDGG